MVEAHGPPYTNRRRVWHRRSADGDHVGMAVAAIHGCMRMPLLRRRSNGFEVSRHYCDHVGGGLALWNPSLVLEWRVGVLVLADFQR